jgi:hypothetical protein
MKKLFIFSVLLCGCCNESSKYPLPQQSPQTIWYEAKQWEVLDTRNPRTPEEYRRCNIRGHFYLFKIMTIKNGDETKEIIVK